MIESREQRSVACRLPQKMEAYKEEEFKLASQVLDQTRSVTIDESLERLSWLMDDLIRVPGLGWRFGLDAIVGLIPGFGGHCHFARLVLHSWSRRVRYRVPKVTLLRMGMNIGIDYLVGSLPLVGDLFDAWWKSNQMKRRTVA